MSAPLRQRGGGRGRGRLGDVRTVRPPRACRSTARFDWHCVCDCCSAATPRLGGPRTKRIATCTHAVTAVPRFRTALLGVFTSTCFLCFTKPACLQASACVDAGMPTCAGAHHHPLVTWPWLLPAAHDSPTRRQWVAHVSSFASWHAGTACHPRKRLSDCARQTAAPPVKRALIEPGNAAGIRPWAAGH